VDEVRSELKRVMEEHAGVFRTQEVMKEGMEKLRRVRERLKEVRLRDASRVFNTARVEALELENLVDISMSVMMAAEGRRRAAAPTRGWTSRTATTELAQAQPLLPARGPPGLEAGPVATPHRRVLPTQRAGVLR
jgi:succinate dehydrogenase / fumarate reductase, flavoprotein subunit